MSARTTRSYPRHSHDQYGIGVVDDGAHSSWSGRGQVESGPGGLICCNPGEITDGRAVGRRPRSWRMLYLAPELMRTICEDIREHPVEFTFAEPVFHSEVTRTLFDRAFAHASVTTKPRDMMSCETALLALAAGLQAHSTARGVSRSEAVGSIRRAKERIDGDPSARVTLSELAREAGVSRFQLLRAFSRHLGVTPHAYILQRRVQLACRLIRAGRGLAETAVLSGFYDQPHLTRCFVRQFGVTPRKFASRSA